MHSWQFYTKHYEDEPIHCPFCRLNPYAQPVQLIDVHVKQLGYKQI